MRTIEGPDELRSLVGQELGVSDWLAVDQDRINLFADATGDHQWIHVDPARAAEGPFGKTIAHGYLTLALLPPLMNNIFEVTNKRMGVNYGLNKVRFPAPLPVDSLIRVRLGIAAVEDVPDGVQVVWLATVERQGGDKPVCVAESITRLYF
ncbi:dehydratase [Mycobacterium heckeshornense]|uniref:MaoC family dehydratase n=1 Tax=Mycobacterium heckeshornense TaxID=110505 RepID=UPI0008FD88A3|nr:MaoC family dehydratase [Mycobacterium heckeshornense]PIJ36158.1 dehydratase [Mycobacterium heckeshornense]